MVAHMDILKDAHILSPQMKAKIALIDFGFTQVEGLMHPDGTYAMSATQLLSMLDPESVRQKHQSRLLKTLLGKEITFAKITVDRSLTQTRPETVLNLNQVKEVIWLLSEKGNETAKAFLKAITIEGFERRFNNAFNVKCTEEEYNEKLKIRMFGKAVRRSWTDVIKDWLIENGYDPNGNYAKFQVYAKVSDMLNVAVFKKTSKELKAAKKLSYNDLLRDNLDCPELELIKKLEDHAKVIVYKHHTHPIDALQQAIDFYL